jgi:hypothetical protein
VVIVSDRSGLIVSEFKRILKKALTVHFFVVDDEPSEEVVRDLIDTPAQLCFFTAVKGFM